MFWKNVPIIIAEEKPSPSKNEGNYDGYFLDGIMTFVKKKGGGDRHRISYNLRRCNRVEQVGRTIRIPGIPPFEFIEEEKAEEVYNDIQRYFMERR